MLGSIIPSSKFLVEKLLDQIDFSTARVIVEYGPGVGNISKELLENMRPDARLVVIEMNGDFVKFLRKSFDDRRLIVVQGSAADVERELAKHGITHVDYVLSGIPFTTIPEPIREKILDSTWKILQPDGKLLVYQFTRAVLPLLRRHFTTIQTEFEPLNILPARLFYCTKPAVQTRKVS
jgi:phospholipid N-methyltransferase